MKTIFFLNKNFITFLMLVLSCIFVSSSYASEDGRLYGKAIEAVKKNNLNSSFMHLSRIVDRYPSSKFFAPALFSLGEYYYGIGDLFDAKNSFEKFVEADPKSKPAVFARAYLVKIAKNNEESFSDYEKEIVTFKRLSLFFRDSKAIKYSSVFLKKYKAIYFIDKVEIYVNEKLFIEIPF